uniref:DRBM domain-containing protein n=1 Tax=Cucumis sativus TaxID=3659 RepID=A0A0A0LCN7_CUCSA
MSQNNATTSTDGVDTNCYEEQNTELNDNEILNDAAIEHTDNVVITEVANEADRSRSCEPTANDSSREPAPVTLHRSSRQLCLPSYLRDFHRNMIGKKHDLMLCKSILSEYTDKMGLERPIYTTKHNQGSVAFFQSTLVFDGVVYTSDLGRTKKEAEQLAARAAILSLHEDATNPKSQKALGDIIASKVRFHAMLQKVKDSNFSQFQPKSMPENTVERVAMTVNEGKELKDAVLDGGMVCGAISEACPTSQFQPEFSATKPDGSSPLMRLPIEFVRSTLEEPVGYHATIGSKRKSKNKRKARKKLCMENRVATETSQTAAPCSVAR